MLLDGLRLGLVGEGPPLYMEELVPVAGTDGGVEAPLAQRARQHFGIFLATDSSNLHHDGLAGKDGGVAWRLSERRHHAGVRLGGRRRMVRGRNSVERCVRCRRFPYTRGFGRRSGGWCM